MTTTREPVVYALMDAALAAIKVEAKRQHATVDEVGSASMTLALHTITVLKNLGGDSAQLRVAVTRLLLECSDDRVSN